MTTAAYDHRSIVVNVFYSEESHGFWANSPDLAGLAASGTSRAEVEQEAMYAAETLYEIKGIHCRPRLEFREATFQPE